MTECITFGLHQSNHTTRLPGHIRGTVLWLVERPSEVQTEPLDLVNDDRAWTSGRTPETCQELLTDLFIMFQDKVNCSLFDVTCLVSADGIKKPVAFGLVLDLSPDYGNNFVL